MSFLISTGTPIQFDLFERAHAGTKIGATPGSHRTTRINITLASLNAHLATFHVGLVLAVCEVLAVVVVCELVACERLVVF